MLHCKRLVCIFWCIAVAKCTIFSYNNKYSNKQTSGAIQINKSEGHVRFKRSASASSPSVATTPVTSTTTSPSINNNPTSNGDKPEIAVSSFEFSGSQKSNTAYIYWIGKGTSECIIVLTCNIDYSSGSRHVVESQVWRSNNYGTSFEPVNFDSGAAKVSFFYTFPSNEKRLLFTDVAAKKVYMTKDELQHWNFSVVPVEPDIVKPHPTDENKILLYSLNQRKLYVSTDFAESWILLSENVLPNFYWAENGFDSDVNLVHMEVEAGIASQANYKACTVPDCKDATFDEVGPFLANSLTVHKEYMFVQKSNLDESESYLMVSYKRQKFQRAYFPGDLKTDDFMLLDLDNDQVFIAVSHGDHVNLYLSDTTGQYYVLSFSNIYHIMRLGYFEIDFHEVQGMNWTYLANKREAKGAKTYISFDKGGNWAPLMLNKNCTMAEECALLLEIKQLAAVTSVLSQENAPGIIIAHGNIGTSFRGQDAAVFTSSDGGATWIKALQPDGKPVEGSYRFNILDQGSILTAVPDVLLTNPINKTVFYSCDEGKHWKQQQFDSSGLIVTGVLTEPGSLTMVESVFGHRTGDMKDQPWTVIKLNFSEALPIKCQPKDYELWYPRDYNNVKSNSNCTLGQMVSYFRRKPDIKCYNGNDVINRTVLNSTCNCTLEDFECDFGYEEVNDSCMNDSCCKQAKWFDDSYSFPECDDGGKYNKSRGYRKVPGDKCIEQDSDKQRYDKVLTDCPSSAPNKLSIVLQARKLPSGREIAFRLEQASGSKFDTKYTWSFGDGSKPEEDTGFLTASTKKHIFHAPGHYTVIVTAENTKGKTNASTSVHVQDPLMNVFMIAPVAGKTGVSVKFTVVPLSSSRAMKTSSDHVHYVWSFGDEGTDGFPMLTWNNSVTHVFNKAGTYTMSLEAVNAVSYFYKERTIQMYDDAEILVLTFSSNVNKYSMNNLFISQQFTLRLRQQLAEDLGVTLARLEAVIVEAVPVTAHLYVFPSTEPWEPDVANIRDTVISQVQKGVLGVNLRKTYESGEIISIVSAKKLSSPDHPAGPNLKAVYIAAPILVLAVVVSLVSFLYCRKKLRALRQYNILNTQDDSDALLDDDEAPLDMNVDFGVRESARDDAILDSSGSHLVLVTGGGGSSDNAENC